MCGYQTVLTFPSRVVRYIPGKLEVLSWFGRLVVNLGSDLPGTSMDGFMGAVGVLVWTPNGPYASSRVARYKRSLRFI